MIYYRARLYDPQQGRFITEDPVGFAGGTNLYAYVNNNPISRTDPQGLGTRKLSDCIKALLKPYFPDLNLDDVVVHDDGLPWWVRTFNTVKGGPGAVTIGNDIYFPPNAYDPVNNYDASYDSIDRVKAIAHELVHVSQFKYLGYRGFIKEYARSYVENIRNQLGNSPGLPPIAPFDGDFTFDTFGLKAIKFIKWLNDVRAAAQRAGNVDLDKAYREITLEESANDFERDLGRFLGEMRSDGIPCECKPKKK